MARSNHPDSAGCQFFVAVGSPSHLDGQYTSFGEVTRGMDVAYSIAEVDAVETLSGERSKPLERIEIRSVTLRPVKR
jgi:peptidyl-prolyl cis-trans isomerase B (cyclophilin B)